MVQRIDAKAEMEELFQGAGDVTHFIGLALLGSKLHAFARIVFPNNDPLKPWPPKLTYRQMLDVTTGVVMFVIAEPGKFVHDVMVVTEWHDSCGAFMKHAEESKMFVVELVTPKFKRIAVIRNDVVDETSELPITPEDYDYLLNQAYHPPPEEPKS